MDRPFLFGTNFKMNQTAPESVRFFDELADATAPAGVQLFLIPPFTSLQAVTERKRESGVPIWVGAQNAHWEQAGAYTGEISVPMLAALDVDLVLLGHAERRAQAGESDLQIHRKVKAALSAGLRVLLCVGESAEEKAFGVGTETISRQTKIALNGLAAADASRIQIAYEPVWSIGSGGTPAEPAEIDPVAASLRAVLEERFGAPGRSIPILYGGSVDATNAGTFARLPNIDGLFVGRAAWTVDGFRRVLASSLAA